MNIENQTLDLSAPVSGDIVSLEDMLGIEIDNSSKGAEEKEEPQKEIEIEDDAEKETPSEDDEQVDIELQQVDSPIPPNEEEQEEEEVAEKPTEKVGVDYKSIINKMVEAGEWEQFDTIETEDGEVPINELEVDEELFSAIVEEQKRLRQEKFQQQSVEGVSDFTKKLIEIEKNGGSVADAINAFQTVKEPLSQIDTSTVEGKKAVIYMQLKAQNQDESDIKRLIRSYEQDGLLDEKAEIAETALNNAYEKYLEKLNDDAIERNRLAAEALKKYTSDFKQEIKNTFELNDSMTKKITEAATKRNKEGRYELDTMYNEYRKDPKKAAELALFLFNKDEYIKQVTNKVKVENNISTFKKLNLVKKNTTQTNVNNKKEKVDESDLLDLSKL